jgi:hypothetical protein
MYLIKTKLIFNKNHNNNKKNKNIKIKILQSINSINKKYLINKMNKNN